MNGKKLAMLYKSIPVFIILVAALFLLMWWKGCHCGGGKGNKNDTISVRIDTFWMKHSDSIVYVPVEKKVSYPVYKELHDTLEIFEQAKKIDTAAIIHGYAMLQNKYFAKRYYDTTVNIEYGTAKIKDTVTQNRLTGRSIILKQSIPEITKTVTLKAPNRTTLYLSLSAMGNEKRLYGSGAGIDLMDKRGRMYGAAYWFTKDNNNWVAGEIKIPIRLRKK